MYNAQDVQVIYFDIDDAVMDGRGWNVLSAGGATAFRYARLVEAIRSAHDACRPYVVVGERTTFSNAADAIHAVATEMGIPVI